MKKPHHFKGVLVIGMVVIVVTYIVFGLLGYLVYGDGICPSITLNLTTTTRVVAKTCVSLSLSHTLINSNFHRVFLIVVLYYAYVIFASFMLQFYVPMDFLEIPFFRLTRIEQWTDRILYSNPRLHKPVTWILHTIFRTVVVLIIGSTYERIARVMFSLQHTQRDMNVYRQSNVNTHKVLYTLSLSCPVPVLVLIIICRYIHC